MARMHSKGKGTSGSSKPNNDTAPSWSESDKGTVEELILKYANDGHSSAKIGSLLRDIHAVPDVRLVMGERISQTLSRNNLDSTYPEDMMNLMRKALSLIDHLSSNKKDLHNRRQLELCESRLRRLAKYYVRTGRISSTWTYKRDQLRLMVCLLYTSPSPRDQRGSRMPSSA